MKASSNAVQAMSRTPAAMPHRYDAARFPRKRIASATMFGAPFTSASATPGQNHVAMSGSGKGRTPRNSMGMTSFQLTGKATSPLSAMNPPHTMEHTPSNQFMNSANPRETLARGGTLRSCRAVVVMVLSFSQKANER